MSRKSKPTIITPEIQAKLDEWQKYADEHGIALSTITNIPFCAKTTVETGHCNCHSDRKCPCDQLFTEIKGTGHCFCKVFWSNQALADEVAKISK